MFLELPGHNSIKIAIDIKRHWESSWIAVVSFCNLGIELISDLGCASESIRIECLQMEFILCHPVSNSNVWCDVTLPFVFNKRNRVIVFILRIPLEVKKDFLLEIIAIVVIKRDMGMCIVSLGGRKRVTRNVGISILWLGKSDSCIIAPITKIFKRNA